MKAIEYFIFRFMLFIGFLFIASPVGMLAVYCDNRWHLMDIRPLAWTFLILVVLYTVAAGWFASRTAHHLAFEQRNLYSSLRFAFYDARLRLGFLPVIGHWFIRADDRQENDDDDQADSAA